MSEQPKETNRSTLLFMFGLSLACAVILSTLASLLQQPQEEARALDRNRQLLIAAQMINHRGNFLLPDGKGGTTFARYENGKLVPGTSRDFATGAEILSIVQKRIQPFLVDSEGNLVTFEEAGIDKNEYIARYQTTGFYRLPYKLIYEILPEEEGGQPVGFVVPVKGEGLWDAIFGFIAIEANGNTVIGISWYDQKETPGLGANIADADWQEQFPGKQIFQASALGEINPETDPMGIVVVKGRVSEIYGDTPRSKSAVDGMAGATLTGNGVTDAYRDVLSAYRPFFAKLFIEHEGEEESLGA